MNQLSDRLNRLSPSATLAMSQKSSELKAQGVDVINLSVGEPDFNTPDHIKEAAKKAVDDNFSRYSPVPGYPALRNAIVAKLKNENGLDYTATQISCANGAKQSVCNTIMALVNSGDEVIVPAPYWVSYPEMVKLADGTPVIVAAGIEQDFKITPAQLETAITPKTKAIILCSPSNPTGSVYSKEELAGLAAVLAKHPHFRTPGGIRAGCRNRRRGRDVAAGYRSRWLGRDVAAGCRSRWRGRDVVAGHRCRICVCTEYGKEPVGHFVEEHPGGICDHRSRYCQCYNISCA